MNTLVYLLSQRNLGLVLMQKELRLELYCFSRAESSSIMGNSKIQVGGKGLELYLIKARKLKQQQQQK